MVLWLIFVNCAILRVKEHAFVVDSNSNSKFRPSHRFAFLLMAMLVVCSQSGCVNFLSIMSKVVMGDPKQVSGFELATGISLKDEEKVVLIHCSAPSYVTDKYGSLTSDVEEELIRRMKRNGVLVKRSDAAADVLDDIGGRFDPHTLAREIDDIDYIMHIQVDQFAYMEPSSSTLYRGNSAGHITGYEVRRTDNDAHTVEIFDQRFKTSYPAAHPVPVDQTPKNVFIRRCIDSLADTLGSSFYDVTRSELYAQ